MQFEEQLLRWFELVPLLGLLGPILPVVKQLEENFGFLICSKYSSSMWLW
jgi:hypothetical protein